MKFVCSLPNPGQGGSPRTFFSNDDAEIEQFAKSQNGFGRGVFDCIGLFPTGASQRTKETVAALPIVIVDLDLKDMDHDRADVLKVLDDLPLPPTEVRDSGNGLHAVWRLKEPLSRDDMARGERAMKLLVELLAGDPAVTHRAALLRRPGTDNTKGGHAKPCHVLESHSGADRVYDISEIEEMLELYGQPLLRHKQREPAAGNGSPNDNESVGVRREGPVDVDARLAAMKHGAKDGTGVNATHCAVIPSLIWQAWHPEEISSLVVEATMKMSERDKLNWDRAEEVTTVNKRIVSAYHNLFEKEYDPSTGVIPVWLNSELHDQWADQLSRGKRPTVVKYKGWFIKGLDSPQVRGAMTSPLRLVCTDGIAATPAEEPDREHHYRFKLTSFRDMRPGPEQLYLVDELIPVAGLVDIWGKAKCFKSFWTLDLMLHIAMGWEYRDHAVRQGSVVYCAFEGGHGYKKRIEALRRHYEIDDDEEVPLHIMAGQANLIADHKLLIRDITLQLDGVKPAVVVLDTLNKSLMGSESKDVDMSAYVRAAEAIRDAFGCVVIIVHHCGLDETRPRGHTSLPGAVDAQLAVSREGNTITVTVEMMRDGPEEITVDSVLEPIEVGTDSAGKILTSLIVKPAGDRPVTAGARWTKPLAIFRRALCQALLDSDQTITIGTYTVRAVDLELVRSAFYGLCIVDGDTEEEKQDTRRKRFRRCAERAQELNLIGVRVEEPTARTTVWLATGEPEGNLSHAA